VYLLQETHVATVTDEQTWTQEWGGSCVWSRGSHRSCGVGILLNPNSEATFKSHLRDNEGRVVSAKLQHRDQEINIINIYAPTVPRERKDFMGKIWNYKTVDTNLILGGDFN
jgi:exonuclease III